MSIDRAVADGPGCKPLSGFDEIHPALSASQALLEADRCLHCGGPGTPAPCVQACPSDVNVPRFIRQILDDDPEGAGRTIFEANALGGSCSRVCPVQELCEGSCVMHKESRRPVEIGRLQRFATDALLKSEKLAHRKPNEGVKRIAVIGAGPAGLACARELASEGYAVTVYEKRSLPGGLVTHAIAPYKQVIEPMVEEVERIQALGVEVQYGVEIGTDLSVEDLKSQHAAIFVGVGMGDDTKAGVPGEDLPGVWESLPFIEKLKLEHGHQWDRTAHVAVIGGGNTAIDVAREAIRLGAASVTMIYRRGEKQMPAFRHEVEAAKREGVRFEFFSAPTRFVGDGKVSGIECVTMALGEPDASGRPRPVPVPGSEHVIPATVVVKAIGQKPRAALLEALGVETEWGLVKTSETYATNVPGIYAGGDCLNGGSTVVEAVQHGKLAARAIHAELGGAVHPSVVPKASLKVTKEGFISRHFQGHYYLGMSTRLCKGCNLCVNSCPMDILTLDAKGKIEVTDMSKCVFCGMCEMRCPDFAIWVVKDDREHFIESEARRRLRQ